MSIVVPMHCASMRTYLMCLLLPLFLSSCSDSGDEPIRPTADEPQVGIRLSSINTDADNDGAIDRRIQIEFDACGRVTADLIDTDNDGVFNDVVHYRYADRRISELRRDNGQDGSIDEYDYWRYDDDGVLMFRLFRRAPDGPVTRRIDYTVGDNGFLTGSRTDLDGDGVVDEVATYERDADGRLEQVLIDSNGDAATDWTTRFFYADDGRVLRSTGMSSDGARSRTRAYLSDVAICDPISNFEPFNYTCILPTL